MMRDDKMWRKKSYSRALVSALAIDGGLDDEAIELMDELLETWWEHLAKNKLRRRYYEGENMLKDLGISIPPALRSIETVVGWPKKAVSALSSRIRFDGFTAKDEEVSKAMERAFRKLRAAVMTSTTVKSVRVNAEGRCEVEIEGKKGPETLTADIVLSAVGIKSNIEGIGLEELGIAVERDKVLVDRFYRTNVPGVYAIGDIVGGPALAHVASAEGICCVEAICGLDPAPVDYSAIPSCVFTSPEVASVGMTEQQAQERGIAYKVGRFPFTASGKATAAGDRDGFVKLLFGEDDTLLGAHMVGQNVTEMIAEPTLARMLGATAHRIARTIHAHPTMNEGVMEAAEAALGEAIHL